MRRREFITLIASAAVTWPCAAQQPAMPVIGVLGSETEFDKIFIDALRQGLSDSGYVEGQIYADRILRGTKPSELPVQLPVKVQLTINLKTAKALGLNVPSSVRLRADEVIE